VQEKINNLLRVPFFFIVFILLGLTFGFLTFKVLSFSRTVDVPDLSNLTLLEANETLTKAGLYLKIEGEDFDASVPSGRILRQDIPAGNKVKEKRSIKVVVSKGPRVFSVPLLVDQTVADASNLLGRQRLRIGRVISVHSDSVEKGKIVAQKPEPDERMTDTITVLVSLGPHELTYHCPDFLGRTPEEAKTIAEKMGLFVETRGSGSVILSQRPKAGAPVKTGSTLFFETGAKEETPYD
jgi:beta-lactam-binding protein with PASTA domain